MDKLRQQLKDLYLTCFPEDSDKYAEFFVQNKFDGTNCLTLFDGDTLICMLYLVKKKMYVRGTVFDVSYLTAGGTLPQYRGKGIFTKLMYKSFEDMRAAGKPFTGLMPFDHDFYKLQAYITHSFYEEREVKKGALPLREISFDDIEQMANVYNAFMKDKNCWFFRDYDAFHLRLREIFLEGGKAYGLFKDGVMQGYILTFDDEEIDEYCALYPELIDEFDTHFETVCVNVGEDGEPDNMFRIFDNKLMMQSIKYPEGLNQSVSFFVDDWYFKPNSGGYRLTVSDGKATVEETDDTELTLTIEQFTQLVCGCYDRGQFDERLEKIFPPCLNCALDKF